MPTKMIKYSLKIRLDFDMNIKKLDTLFIHSTIAIISRKSRRMIEIKHNSMNIDFVDIIKNNNFVEIELII